MPTRIIREGILTSETVNQLSPAAELFYRRLMSVADDHGRYYANPTLLRSACYPLKIDQYKDKDVKRMLSECEATEPQPLIVVYGGGKYIQVTNFRQQTRSKSKFPEPVESEVLSKCISVDIQPCILDGGVDGGGGVDGDGGGADRRPLKRAHGEFSNVKLTEEEHQKLFEAYGGNGKMQAAIDALDAYIEAKGKKYRSHYAVMKRDGWVWKRVHEESAGRHRPPDQPGAYAGSGHREGVKLSR